AIVVGEHEPGLPELRQRRREAQQSLAVIQIGRLRAELTVDLRQGGAPEPIAARAEINEPERARSIPGGQCRCQSAAGIVDGRERGHDERYRSDTLRSSAPSCQLVLIDRESLPTGMAMPSAGQSSLPTARTVS